MIVDNYSSDDDDDDEDAYPETDHQFEYPETDHQFEYPETDHQFEEEWKEFYDPESGCTYFNNGKVSTWDEPSTYVHLERPLRKEGWLTAFDASSGCFFYHRETNESVWA